MKAKAILFVDDDPQIAGVMKTLLGRAGYYFVHAADGNTAVEILSQKHFDLIVTDYQMPGMNGLQFLEMVRDRGLSHAPALMMSGETNTEIRKACYKLGVYDFISKPEDVEIILKRVENGLSIAELLMFRARMDLEMMGAKKLHESLFPKPRNSSNGGIRIKTFVSPLIEIGGDYWDFFGDENHTWFYLADITGHGIGAALFTSVLRLVFRKAAAEFGDPALVLAAVSAELSDVLGDRMYVSMFCGLIKPRENKISFANAGHPPPICRTNGRLHRLRSVGTWIGTNLDIPYETAQISFGPADWLYMCTDGILEGSSIKDGKSGKRFVFEAIKAHAGDMHQGFALIQDFVQNDLVQQDDCAQLLIWREEVDPLGG